MNRREMIVGSGFAVAALLPEVLPDTELTEDEIAALQRLTAKIDGGRAGELFEIEITGGSKTTIELDVRWTDADMIMLRESGVLS